MAVLEEICALAATFDGGPGDGAAALEACCKAALTELGGRLKVGVTPESCRDALIPAAAWLALSMLAQARGAGGIERFSVADLAVQTGAEQSARALRTQAEALMAPYLEGGFAFLGVRG